MYPKVTLCMPGVKRVEWTSSKSHLVWIDRRDWNISYAIFARLNALKPPSNYSDIIQKTWRSLQPCSKFACSHVRSTFASCTCMLVRRQLLRDKWIRIVVRKKRAPHAVHADWLLYDALPAWPWPEAARKNWLNTTSQSKYAARLPQKCSHAPRFFNDSGLFCSPFWKLFLLPCRAAGPLRNISY